MEIPCTPERLARCPFVNQHTLAVCMCRTGAEPKPKLKASRERYIRYWLAQAEKWSPTHDRSR